MRASILLSTLAMALVAQATSLTGPRTLVLLDTLDDADVYTDLWSDLEGRHFNLTINDVSSPVSLTKYDYRLYDHLIFLAPKMKEYPKGMNAKAVIGFMAEGGNVIMAGSSELANPLRELSREFDVEFDNRYTSVLDHFNYDKELGQDKHDAIVVNPSSHMSKIDAIVPQDKLPGPILFRGIGHSVNPKNSLLTPILWAPQEAYSWESVNLDESADQDPLIAGKDISLVSVMQARNNARIAFLGSTEMLSDAFFGAPAKKQGDKETVNGNRKFIEELTKWTFQEKSALDVVAVQHHKIGEEEAPAHYRIKDNMTYTISLAEYREGEWHPFSANDVQLELIMLDPYVRKTLEQLELDDQSTVGTFTTTLQLPDQYGVFKFMVNYKRPGLTYIESVTTVGIHPFRHDQYPRFISQAKPYYTSAASMGVGLLIFSFVYLWGGLDSTVKTTKKA
ncbi:MAG: dolichyl-di-phosphooligosaccharide-protein glycotransferase [Linnemannia elongata]|nr:MAG: dolichyl-di-phosphooligosaccharide-protein glycotransferase [Linnemannia elongata]